MLLLISAQARIAVCAQEEQKQSREVIVVMDCSKSMEDVDSQYLVYDFVRGLAASLPMNCEMGFVAYNNEVCAALRSEAATRRSIRRWTGSSTGSMEMRARDSKRQWHCSGQSDRKSMILISDGEIMMDTDQGTEESASAFSQTVSAARNKGIEIDVLAIGEKIQEGCTVYAAADETGGSLYEIVDPGSLYGYVGRYLFEEWGYRGSHIGKMDGTNAELTVSLPDCMMERAKILLTGAQRERKYDGPL